jgi:hypothetical protein
MIKLVGILFCVIVWVTWQSQLFNELFVFRNLSCSPKSSFRKTLSTNIQVIFILFFSYYLGSIFFLFLEVYCIFTQLRTGKPWEYPTMILMQFTIMWDGWELQCINQSASTLEFWDFFWFLKLLFFIVLGW